MTGVSHEGVETPKVEGGAGTEFQDDMVQSELTTEGDCVVDVKSNTMMKMKEEEEEEEQLESGRDVDTIFLQKAKTQGVRNLKRNSIFFFKMMFPVIVVCTWMFALFSLLSWLVPHVLCEDTSKELSGSSIGISECVYNSKGQYNVRTIAKAFWLLFWSVQNAWLAIFPGFIAFTLFGGSSIGRSQWTVIGIASLSCFCAPMVTALVYDMALNNYINMATSVLGSFISNVACSSSAVKYTKDRVMRWRWIFLFLLAGQVNTLYLLVMPRLLTQRAADALGGMGITVVRLFVHPVIWSSVLILFRSFQRHVGSVQDLQQLENVGSIVIMNFMFACFSISNALSGRGSLSPWLSFLYGKRAKDAMEASPEEDEIELSNKLALVSMESASIFAASSLFTFGSIATVVGTPPNISTTWLNAFAQLATTIIFTFIEIISCGKFHHFEWNKSYPKSTTRFLGYVLLVLTIGGSRLCVELLLLFCPRHYDEHGILLEQCDKESLFQQINLSFGREAIAPVDGPWVTLGRQEL